MKSSVRTRSTELLDLKEWLAFQGEHQVPILILGTSMPALTDRIHLAVNLWRRDFASVVVASGGACDKAGSAEAATMASILSERGIPEEQIVVENRSGNTIENIAFALIRPVEIKSNHSAIVIVTHNYHGRRVSEVCRLFGLRHFVLTVKGQSVCREASAICREIFAYARWRLLVKPVLKSVLKEKNLSALGLVHDPALL